MKLPESLTTDNPKEAIGFAIAYAIEEGVLPENFKMSKEGYAILESAILAKWDGDSQVVNEIMIAFIAGYATGSRQVTYKDG